MRTERGGERILPGAQFKPFLATVFSHWKPAGEPNAHASTRGRLLIHGGGQRRGADVGYSPVRPSPAGEDRLAVHDWRAQRHEGARAIGLAPQPTLPGWREPAAQKWAAGPLQAF